MPDLFVIDTGLLLALTQASGLGPLQPTDPPDPTAADIEEAIVTTFEAAGELVGLAGGIFQGQASDTVEMPYVVFRVVSSPLGWVSSTSQWDESRIRFECYASTAESASAMALALVNQFNEVSLSYESGITTPLILADRSKAAERARTRSNKRVFRATVDYGCKARLGRP